MSSNSDLEVRKREISALVDGVIALERSIGLVMVDPMGEVCEFDRMEAMDTINRIERRILAKMPAKQAAE